MHDDCDSEWAMAHASVGHPGKKNAKEIAHSGAANQPTLILGATCTTNLVPTAGNVRVRATLVVRRLDLIPVIEHAMADHLVDFKCQHAARTSNNRQSTGS